MNDDLLLYSMSTFRDLIIPVLEVAKARRIVEVGAEYGAFTHDLCAYAQRQGGQLITIDPEPQPAALQFAATLSNAPHFRFIKATSLEALPQLDEIDAYLLDGDHNYYTVRNELELIWQRRASRPFLVFAHDVGWPCSRRDMYYAEERIPAEYRHPSSREGVVLDNPGMVPWGFRICSVARQEGGPKNGVLTAIEDFLAGHPDLQLDVVPAVFGLGVIYSKDATWYSQAAALLAPYANNPLLARLERNRLKLYLRVLEDAYHRSATPAAAATGISEQNLAALAPEQLRLRAKELGQRGAWAEASEHYRALTKTAPHALDGWLGRWECCTRQGHDTLADLVLDEALELHPEWLETLKDMAAAQTRNLSN